jgi:hypothetical protein
MGVIVRMYFMLGNSQKQIVELPEYLKPSYLTKALHINQRT